MNRLFLLFTGLLFSASPLWARTDMTGYDKEFKQNVEAIGEKAMQTVEEVLRALKALLGQPFDKLRAQPFDPKNAEQLSKDIYAKLKISPPKAEGFSLDEILEERGVFIRFSFKYDVERNEIWHQEEEDLLIDYQHDVSVERNFYGILQKVYNKSRKIPDEYHFHLDSTESENPYGKARFYRKGKVMPKDGREPYEITCRSDQWNVETGAVQFDPLFEETVPESQAQHYILWFEPGVSPPAEASCTGFPMTVASFLGPFAVVLDAADVETLYQEGYLSKAISSRHPVDFLSPGNLDPNRWLAMPKEHLIVQDIRKGNKYGRSEARVEFFLEPRIEGPHFIALPTHTVDPEENAATLRADDIPNWQVSKIRPREGWEKALQIVVRKNETGSPSPSLQLGAKKPGSVEFVVDWVNAKGKKGESRPHRVTVVKLNFQKLAGCIGFDNSLNTVNPVVPAMSACVKGDPKDTMIDIQPKGTSIRTRLKKKGGSYFDVLGGLDVASPESADSKGEPEFETFPQYLLVRGKKKGEGLLSAFVEVDKDQWQHAADLMVDVLNPWNVDILPVVLLKPPPVVLPSVDTLFDGAQKTMDQACVKVKKWLPTEEVDYTQIPDYTEGDELVYGGAGTGHIEFELRKKFGGWEQDVTAVWVPDIVTIQSGGQKKKGNPLGFLQGDFIFLRYFNNYPHVFAHEIGHYLFGEIYSSLEGMYHTEDPAMLMYHHAASNCEIRQIEWRKAHD